MSPVSAPEGRTGVQTSLAVRFGLVIVSAASLPLPLGQPTPGRKGRREDVPVGLGPAPLHTPLRARGSAAEGLGADRAYRRATPTKR